MSARSRDPALISAVGEFFNRYLPNVRRRDDDTIASYKSSMRVYLEYLSRARGVTLATMTASDLGRDRLADFLDWLASERGNAATTINHRLSDMRGLCRYLRDRKVIDEVSWLEIAQVGEVPDKRAVEFRWLTVPEVRAVIGSVAANRDAVRDSLMLSLLYESGARVGEVLSLTVGDLRPTRDGAVDAHFLGKGNKHRTTPLSAEIWVRFNGYADSYLPNRRPSDLVFYVRRREERHKMSHDNVERVLRDCERRLRDGDMPKIQHLHSHLLRRSRAMHLYEAGVPLEIISEWLGHSSIETTRFYAKVTDLMRREALEKLSEGDEAVFDSDVAFKYAEDDEVLRRLCGLK